MRAHECEDVGRVYRRVERKHLAAQLRAPLVRAQDAYLRGRLLGKRRDEGALRADEREQVGLHSVASEQKARARAGGQRDEIDGLCETTLRSGNLKFPFRYYYSISSALTAATFANLGRTQLHDASMELSGVRKQLLEKQAELGRTYLKELRRDVRSLMLTAEESFDGALIGKMTEKLDEAELKELQRVYGKKSAQVMGVQLCYGGEERSAGDESDFRV